MLRSRIEEEEKFKEKIVDGEFGIIDRIKEE